MAKNRRASFLPLAGALALPTGVYIFPGSGALPDVVLWVEECTENHFLEKAASSSALLISQERKAKRIDLQRFLRSSRAAPVETRLPTAKRSSLQPIKEAGGAKPPEPSESVEVETEDKEKALLREIVETLRQQLASSQKDKELSDRTMEKLLVELNELNGMIACLREDLNRRDNETATLSPPSIGRRGGKKVRQTAGHGAGTTPSCIGHRPGATFSDDGGRSSCSYGSGHIRPYIQGT
uniref:Uncharacterized protein n=1 Tax=Anopheles farauti TaxID=69004 RepID=A0A182QRX7_9DIPT